MSQRRVAEVLTSEYKKAAHKIPQYIGVSNTSNIVDVTFRTDEFVPQFVLGLKKGLKPYIDNGDIDEDYLTVANASTVKKVFKHRMGLIKRGTGGTGGHLHLRLKAWDARQVKPGTFYLRRAKGGAGITFRFISSGSGRGTGANDTKIQAVVRHMRNAVYQDWVNEVGEAFTKSGLPKGGPRTKMKSAITKETQIAHEEQTTKGALALGLLKELDPEIDVPVFITIHDVVEEIENSIGLNYGRNFKKKKLGNFSFRYMIETSIRPNAPGSEATDITNVNKVHIKQAVHNLYKKRYGVIGAWLFRLSGSKAPKDQVVEDTIKDIARPLTKAGKPDMRYRVNSDLKKLKTFKPMKDSFTGKKAKPSKKPKVSRKVIRVRGKSKTVLGKEKGKGKESSTADQWSLAKLRSYIDGRLPAEVRRNMGKDGALRNRKGRFSSSVELVSLTEAQQTIVAKYTYMLSPYQTFENTGRRRWPLAYNPKDLIAKSIRNLAKGRIEQKLTLRRV